MSMLSAQIDELRKAAEYYDGSEVASIMRYAADTIWQLRDDLQRTNAVLMDVEHDESMAWDRVCKAEAEAERLRELCVDLYDHAAFSIDYFGDVHGILPRMRELGIPMEVDK